MDTHPPPPSNPLLGPMDADNTLTLAYVTKAPVTEQLEEMETAEDGHPPDLVEEDATLT